MHNFGAKMTNVRSRVSLLVTTNTLTNIHQ